MRLDPADTQSDIKLLLEKNIELSEQILHHAKKTHHHLMWDRAFSMIKLLIIIAPFIVAAWYFPKYFKQFAGMVTDIGKQFEFAQQQLKQLGALQQQAEQLQRNMPKIPQMPKQK